MRYSLLATICTVTFLAASASNAQGISNLQVPDTATAKALTMPETPTRLPVARNGEVIDSVGSGATEAVLPGVQSIGGISYITGGVGDEELAEMKAQEPNFNVRVLIAASTGEFMSDVALRVLDSKNNPIFKLDNAGPLFYVNLPAGSYTIEAANESGVVKTQKLTAPAKPSASGNRIVIRF
jgi:hypothetical protein